MSILSQNPLGFAFNMVELPAVNGPPQAHQYEQHQDHRQRNEQIQNVHVRLVQGNEILRVERALPVAANT